MKPIRFDPQQDLAPIPFEKRICREAARLKALGLKWRPHAGCFVWDPETVIKAPSPFPESIYFVLSMPRFIDIFGSIEHMVQKLVWLPTWYQARELCRKLGLADVFGPSPTPDCGGRDASDELLGIYGRIGEHLQIRREVESK